MEAEELATQQRNKKIGIGDRKFPNIFPPPIPNLWP